MGPHAWITAFACIGTLGLAILVTARGPRNALTSPFALVTGILFAWNFASFAYEVYGAPVWFHLDFLLSPQVTPAALLFTLTFLGRRRQLRPLLIAVYAAFGVMSALAAMRGIGTPLISIDAWVTLHGVLLATVTGIGLTLLYRHLGEAVGDAEQLHTRALILALALLPILGATELGNMLWNVVPRLGSLGSLLSAMLFARVALGLDLFGERRSPATLGYAALLGGLGVIGYIGLLQALGTSRAVIAFGLTTATLVLVAAGRQLASVLTERRARISQFATLGRFSAQMAHDLKNPLAALKGAVQLLQEERKRGRDLAASGPIFDLMEQQVDRLGRVIDTYQRLGKVEPQPRPVRVNDLVRGVCGLQSLAPPEGIRLDQQLAEDLPEAPLDPELLSTALENLVRNGIQAMSKGGKLTVRTSHGDQDRSVVITVEDTGVGMDARTRERASDPFFTTKKEGSGMGLAFVRRVVEAHGGRMLLTSREGEGTQIRLVLPT